MELSALKNSLKYINKHIYHGENLEEDCLKIQDCIDQIKDRNRFMPGQGENLEWIIQEGHMKPGFLHLEDISRKQTGIHGLKENGLSHTDTDSILRVIETFYTELYKERDNHSLDQIDHFLSKIPSLPKAIQDVSNLGDPISVKECEEAIARLRSGKAPGSDGLIAEFYKHFDQELSLILCDVFNKAFEDSSLSPSQKLAVIILLFKKGDTEELTNYRPIYLTNADYKILAYILTNCITSILSDIISVNQTAYMKNRFIGTNMRSVQDATDHFAQFAPNNLVLFLDFKKAFDTVSHQFLFCLLLHIGLPPDFVKWAE